MSQAKVYVNGQFVGQWAYGYNSFHFDISDFINKDGKNNTLAVRLENLPESSRWYPGAGLYRNVHLIVSDKVHIPIWGTQLTTPSVSKSNASVNLKITVDGADKIITVIHNAKGKKVAQSSEAKVTDTRLVQFATTGVGGHYRAAANGDPTCLDLFHLPEMHLFSGKLTAIVQANETPSNLTFTASADGLQSASITIKVK